MQEKTLIFETNDHIQLIDIIGNTSNKNVKIKQPNTNQKN